MNVEQTREQTKIRNLVNKANVISEILVYFAMVLFIYYSCIRNNRTDTFC